MEQQQLDMDLLSEDEASALKETPPIGDESESTSDEEKVETGEPSPPEKKIEEPPKEPVPVKVEEPKPIKEPEPKPPTIDGIIAKDGKNFIPFSVLEEERTKRQEAETRRQQLEAEVVELKKPKPEPVKELVKEPEKKVEPAPIDFKAMGKKLYESEDGAAEVLQQMFQAGVKAGETSGATAAKSTSIELDFKKEVQRIKVANPWIDDPIVEGVLFNRALEIMEERKIREDDLPAMVKAAEDAVAQGRKKFRVDEPKVDLEAERTKAREEGRNEGVKQTLAKFNIKEPDAVTLANVRNLNPDITSKFDEIDKKIGIDFEEAYGLLTPEEKDAFLKRTP